MIKTDRIVIALDQSYTETGWAVGRSNKILNAGSFKYQEGKSTLIKLETLKKLYNALRMLIATCATKGYREIDIYLEQVRLEGRSTFDYLKQAGAMEMLIKHCVHTQQKTYSSKFKINLFSVATISWKSNIVGNTKGQINKYKFDPKKYPTMLKCVELGYEKYLIKPVSKQTRNGIIKVENGQKYSYNDNIADAICICMYGQLPIKQQKRNDLLL